jgi:sugar phosphate isomerase/epimerase/dienelactone hydrolase
MRFTLTFLTAAILALSLTSVGHCAEPHPRWPFFAFDNGLRDMTPEQQASLLKELGYAGIGYTGTNDLTRRLKAFDDAGLRVFNLYVGATIGKDRASFDPGIGEAMTLLKGRDVALWLFVKRAPDAATEPAAEAQAVQVVRDVADLAAAGGVQVVLYPHTGMYVETTGDAVRIAKAAERSNVGVTFNLCHFLRVDKPENLERVLTEAAPLLRLVSINGADADGKDWPALIRPLDEGSFDVGRVLQVLDRIGYRQPIGLQCYDIKLPPRDQLTRSIAAWRKLVEPFQLVTKSDASSRLLPESERKQVLAELATLEQKLADLRKDERISADAWADANVFVKGVVWANDFGPVNDAHGRELIQTGLRRAKERVDALATGRQPWAKRPGAVARGFVSKVDGSTQPYGLIAPRGYNGTKPMRLDVVLHGSRGDRAQGIAELQFLAAFDKGDAATDETRKSAPDVDYLELQPLGRLGENAYRFEGETDVDEAIEAVCRNYNVDRSRIVLRGSSLGGVGAWAIGLKRPDKWAAVGPTAGPVDTYVFAAARRANFIPLAPLTPWQKKMLHEVDAIDYAANAGMVPVVALMGDRDEYWPSHLLMKDAFAREGVPFVSLVDPGAGHGPGAKAVAEQVRMLGERAASGKDPAPKRVHFVTWTLKFSRCYWIELLGLGEHYARAEIDAQLADDGSVTMAEPKNVMRLAISPPALQSAAATITIGGTKIELPPPTSGQPRTVVIERRHDGTWHYVGRREEVALSGKRPGLQGPIDDAFATQFLCVRPSGKAWNPAVGAWAEVNLNRFADEWRRHYRGKLPVKNDTDVTPEDVRRCNLILFGDPGSNRWIADVLPKLPPSVKWTRDELAVGETRYPASSHALEMIYPNPLPGGEQHYVVFNSGHTYHDYELQLSYMVFPRLGDWAIAKINGSDETTIISGFFDEEWTNAVLP